MQKTVVMGIPLPLELPNQNFGYFNDGQDIKSIRLVYKYFEAMATLFLTSTALYSPNSQRQLAVLLQKSQHPWINKYIRTLICKDTFLTTYLQASQWEAWRMAFTDHQTEIAYQKPASSGTEGSIGLVGRMQVRPGLG